MGTVLPFAARVMQKIPRLRVGRALPPIWPSKDRDESRFEAFEARPRRMQRAKPRLNERAIDALLAVVYVAASAALAWAVAVAL